MKKLVAIVLTVCMLFTQASVVLAGGEIDPPFIHRVDIVQEGTADVLAAKAGGTYQIVLKLRNMGNSYAKSIIVSSDVGQSPLKVETVDSNIVENLNAGKTKEFVYAISVDETAKRGKHPIKFIVEAKQGDGQIVKKEITTYVQVTNEKIKPLLVVKNIVQKPTTINAKDQFDMTFTVVNNGELSAKEVKVYLDGFKTDGFLPVDLTPYQYVGEIAPGEEKTFTFKLSATEKIKEGANELKLKMDFNDGTEKAYTDENTVYIKIANGTAIDKTKPRIIVDDYSVSGDLVAGNEFFFKFNATNVSKNTELKNIKITVSTDGTFVIKSGSGSFWLETLKPGGKITKDLVFTIKSDSLSKSSPINIKFDYEYGEEGLANTSEEVITLPITEQTKLVVNEVNAMGGMMVNQMGTVSFEVINMGKAALNNVTAIIEGDLGATAKMTYVGNFPAGKSESYDIEVTPTAEGEIPGTLVLTYEDSNGKKLEQRREFVATVMPAYVEPEMPIGPEVPIEEEKKSLPLPVIAGEVVLFLLSILISKKVVINRFMKKQEEQF